MESARLLLVDDHKEVVRDLADVLVARFPKMNIDTCNSGNDAIVRLRALVYDTIITDIRMPGMDGFELLATAKKELSATPIIFIAGARDHEIAVRALRGGAFDYIVKPVDVHYFASAVERALHARQKELDLTKRHLELVQRAAALTRMVEDRTRELEVANRMKDDFIATISHELRTPLTAMLGWARLLQEGKLSGQEQAQAIAAINRSASHQARLIADLLDVARIVAGKLRISRRPIDLDVIVRSALDGIAPAAKAKNITLESEIVPCRVLGDADRLLQVVSNILSNAVKFTRVSGNISLKLTVTPPFGKLVVRDDGIGISADLLPRIFDRFRQGGESKAGLGVGLSIVKHLVELHEGEVFAQSAGLERGTTIVVTLPIFDVAKSERSPRASQRPAMTIAGTRVLVIEDDVDVRSVLRKTLEQHGAQIFEAPTIQSALEQLSRRPDAVLCDISMPDADGYSFVRALRQMPDSARLPVAALTAHARVIDIERAMSEGFDMHLTKPIEPDALIHAVAELVNSRLSSAD